MISLNLHSVKKIEIEDIHRGGGYTGRNFVFQLEDETVFEITAFAAHDDPDALLLPGEASIKLTEEQCAPSKGGAE